MFAPEIVQVPVPYFFIFAAGNPLSINIPLNVPLPVPLKINPLFVTIGETFPVIVREPPSTRNRESPPPEFNVIGPAIVLLPASFITPPYVPVLTLILNPIFG